MSDQAVVPGGVRRYGAVLAQPHMGPLFAAAFIGRLPVGMYSLATVLVVSDATGSFAIAGAATGGFAIAAGLSSPFLGRLIDRVGQTPVLVACAIGFPVAVTALIVVIDNSPHAVPVVACAVASGLTFPPLFATLRALISTLAGGLTETAFALEAILQELFFIVGPLIVALLVAIATAKVALAVAAALVTAGTLAFAATTPSRQWKRASVSGRGRTGALSSPGIRTIVLTSVVDGLTFGSLEVALPAFGQAHGSSGMAGVMLGTLAFGSLLGGVWYGAREWSRDPGKQLVLLAWPLAIGLATLALADSIPVMIGLLFVAGVFVAPSAAASFSLVGRLAPPGAVTEAFTWLSTGVTVGFALGGAAAGVLVQHVSVEAALLTTAGCALLAAAVLFVRRATLRPA